MEIFDQKIAFFSAFAHPSKLVSIGAYRKILGSITKIEYLKIVQRGDPLGRQVIEFPRGGRLNPLVR